MFEILVAASASGSHRSTAFFCAEGRPARRCCCPGKSHVAPGSPAAAGRAFRRDTKERSAPAEDPTRGSPQHLDLTSSGSRIGSGVFMRSLLLVLLQLWSAELLMAQQPTYDLLIRNG